MARPKVPRKKGKKLKKRQGIMLVRPQGLEIILPGTPSWYESGPIPRIPQASVIQIRNNHPFPVAITLERPWRADREPNEFVLGPHEIIPILGRSLTGATFTPLRMEVEDGEGS